DGNTDVFIVPAEGGVPQRLTWHPGADQVRGFTPDGKAVLFISGRAVFTNRYVQLFTIPVSGGIPEKLDIPNAFRACYSPDGKGMAYVPLSEAFHQWKRYRGGTHSVIWIYMFSDHSVVKIPQPEGRCNDTDPMWIEDKIYFRSDRNGEFNLFSYEVSSQKIEQLTRFSDFPIIRATAGDGEIIFEQSGYLHLFDKNSARSQKITIGVAADLMEVRPRFVSGPQYVRSASLSPSGVRAVFGFRGDVVTVPGDKGDPRNITQTPGVHERDPVWSPDGGSIAYFSDRSGEYALHVKGQDGKGEARVYALNGSGFYQNPVWAPDSQKICYADNSLTLYWIDLMTGTITTIGKEALYMPSGRSLLRGVWSPDSRWITYALNTRAYFQKVYLYSLQDNRSRAVTDGLSEVQEPVFDAGGKYLYFLASTDAGPVKHWFAMSNADMRMTSSIYVVVLPKGEISPLVKESDEVKVKEDEDKKAPVGKDEKKAEKAVDIEFEGIRFRILDLPVPAGNYYNLKAGEEGMLYFLEGPADGDSSPGDTKLHRFNLNTREDEVLGTGIGAFDLSFDGKKLLYSQRGSFAVVPAGKIKPGDGTLNIGAIQVKIDPRSEWPQIFDEAWRINRDFFYDPNFHGVDWPGMKKKYTEFLPHLSCRSDLNRVVQWMCSELSVGHHRVGGGDVIGRPDQVPGGLLGADYRVEKNRYRFAKIYGGLNWNPNLRSPLTEPGVDVREGEYLLTVQGKDVIPPTNIYMFFENTSGKKIEITVGPDPSGRDARTVEVVPISNEYALRNRDWVEGNIKKVDEATGGRVAYVYVPNTTSMGHVYFKRYFFPQSHKDAIIVDERFNGGGQVADYYIDLLRRPYISHWNLRYGEDLITPSGSIQGPKVMLIDETAGS
ncbi:MAG: PDZ domain-containing protein, partial [Candidatus Aminicenantes bacterium]|nr:PDZ domain-containing protein [Candidatus Aminicenantes bacterium]